MTQLTLVDDARLARIEATQAEILRRLQAVNMTPAPEWVPLAEYAAQINRTPKTVRNWIRAGRIESRRSGSVLLVKAA